MGKVIDADAIIEALNVTRIDLNEIDELIQECIEMSDEYSRHQLEMVMESPEFKVMMQKGVSDILIATSLAQTIPQDVTCLEQVFDRMGITTGHDLITDIQKMVFERIMREPLLDPEMDVKVVVERNNAIFSRIN